MRLAIKIIAIVGICLGGLALLSVVGNNADNPGSTLFGAFLFIGWGIIDLAHLSKVANYK